MMLVLPTMMLSHNGKRRRDGARWLLRRGAGQKNRNF